jgi:hypothetical protein
MEPSTGEKGEVANRWGAEALFSCEVRAQLELRTVLVRCTGELGIDASDWFEDRLPSQLQNTVEVHFDLSDVQQIDPDGAALLMRLVLSLLADHVRVKIHGTLPVPMLSLLILRVPQRIGYELFEN